MLLIGNDVLVQNLTVNTTSNNSVQIVGLHPGTKYQVRVAGINSRGIGAFSFPVYNTTYLCNIIQNI